jgi:hypothetical protein
MARWPLSVVRELAVRRAVEIAGFNVEAWPVEHSLRAPAVGFRISECDDCLFYVPDVAALVHPRRTLAGVELYVGDGAVLTRSLTRSRGSSLVGHASVAQQLDWCQANGVHRAIFTHCGSAIVRANARSMEALVHSLGLERGLDARLAYDGLTTSFVSRRFARRGADRRRPRRKAYP